MKIVFNSDYFNAKGIKSIEFHDDCKVGWAKQNGIKFIEVYLHGEIIFKVASYDVKEVILDE